MRILGVWRPNNRSTHCHNRAVRSCLCALALALGTTIASGQYLESTIMLPDTLGPLKGPYHLACTDNPAFPRLYIGGEADSGGIIVAQAITCKRLARIPAGRVRTLCYVPPHNKLYVGRLGYTDSVWVVDCATNQIVKAAYVPGPIAAMQYNSQNDKLYCGGNSVSAIDCAADTLVHTIPVAASAFALDSSDHELYAGNAGSLSVIDCDGDSLVATVTLSGRVGALCFNPTAQKVYVASGDTLYAIQTGSDSIVARLPFAGLAPVLTCDPQRNRIYCAYSARWASIDCVDDTVTVTRGTGVTPYFMACNVARDRLYVFREYTDAVTMYDATTGQQLTYVMLDGVPSGGGWSPSLDRLFCAPSSMNSLLSVVDGVGDSIAGIVPLTMRAGSLSLDTVYNRLYFAYASTGSGCIGVADCSLNVVTSYTYAGEYPAVMCYNPNNNRLYWGTGSAMIVYDCSTNTVIGTVKTSGGVRAARLHLGLNKLYALALASGSEVIDVIDCDVDSVVRTIMMPGGNFVTLLLVPEDNRLWYLATLHVTAIDCLGDSIVADAPDTLGSIDDACACPEDRKIFAGWSGRPLWIIDMDNPAHVETLRTVLADRGMRFCYVPNAHKVYWCANYSGHPPGNSFFRVIDTRTSIVSDSFWAGRQVSGMCLDHTGNYVYCAVSEDSLVLVIDARADSVVAAVQLPWSVGAPLLNTRTNRMYMRSNGDVIPVVRDSILIGLEELKSTVRPSGICPTLACRGVPLRSTIPAELYDASGRRATVLRPGLNDISHLARGIYFRRGMPDGRTTKVIVVR